MKTLKIYALICPLTKDVRYVGRTTLSLKQRTYTHFYPSSKGKYANAQKTYWISGLIKQNLLPIVILLEESINLNDLHLEKKWILIFEGLKCNLTNVNY